MGEGKGKGDSQLVEKWPAVSVGWPARRKSLEDGIELVLGREDTVRVKCH